MDRPADSQGQLLERYREYLNFLAKVQVVPQLHGKLDIAGLIQQTLLEAFQELEKIRVWNEAQQAAWLRRILANNLRDELRKWHTQARDVTRERSLEAAAEESASRIDAWLVADQSSPSQQVEREEQSLRLAQALAALPEAQREALVLQHWHGWTLAQIAKHLGRTPAAVAGLLHRGLDHLRKYLQERE